MTRGRIVELTGQLQELQKQRADDAVAVADVHAAYAKQLCELQARLADAQTERDAQQARAAKLTQELQAAMQQLEELQLALRDAGASHAREMAALAAELEAARAQNAADAERFALNARELEDAAAQARNAKAALEARVAELTMQLEGQPAAAAEAKQREAALRPSLNSKTDPGLYDVVIDAHDIRGLFGDGAPVLLGPQAGQFFQTTTTCAKVSVLGNFNVGKTFLLTKVAGNVELPAGTLSHTRGISMKLVNLASDGDQQAVFIDTVGRNSPAPDPVEGTELPDVLQLQKALEEMVKQFVLMSADVFLFVIGELSASDQLELYNLYRELTKKRKQPASRAQRVIVVHNLQSWTADMLEAERYPERIQKIFAQSREMRSSLTVQRNGSMGYLTGWVGRGQAGDAEGVAVQHYFVTNEHEPANNNAAVYARLRSALVSGTAACQVDVCDELTKSIGHWLPWYVSVPSGTAGTVRFTEGHRLQVVTADGEPIDAASVSARNRSLGSIVTCPSDEVAYNFVTLQTARRKWLAMCMEAPGLDAATLDCYYSVVEATDDAVMRAGEGLTDGGRRSALRVWVDDATGATYVHLLASLSNAAAAAFADGRAGPAEDEEGPAAEVSSGGFTWTKSAASSTFVGLGKVTAAPQAADAGTRAIADGAASRRVTLLRSFASTELAWRMDEAPQFVLADGVLCVLFALNTAPVRRSQATRPATPLASAAPRATAPDDWK
jgi:predicted  nucleic acid-binding Zn-ribbon protein